jgi:hypothetical protein
VRDRLTTQDARGTLMASQNGGHITRIEQRALNQQESRVSRKIGE